jgi:hypothetical protein
MQRSRQLTFLCGAVAAALALIYSSAAHARIDVNLILDWGGVSSVERWNTSTASQVMTYQPLEPWASNIEVVSSIAMKGDAVYLAGNGLGTINVLQFDVATGSQSGDYPAYLGGVTDMTFGATGNLYTAGANGFGFDSVVRWLTPNPGGTVKERTIATNDVIWSLAVSADGQSLHVLHTLVGFVDPSIMPTRVSTYLLTDLFPADNSTPATLPAPTNSFGVDLDFRDMTLGPDGLLYLSDLADERVDRFSVAGAAVDTFTNFSAHNLEFVDGRLLALSGGQVVEIDAQTGALLQTLVPAGDRNGIPFRFIRMEAFAVPEPTTLGLASCIAIAAAARGRRRIA